LENIPEIPEKTSGEDLRREFPSRVLMISQTRTRYCQYLVSDIAGRENKMFKKIALGDLLLGLLFLCLPIWPKYHAKQKWECGPVSYGPVIYDEHYDRTWFWDSFDKDIDPPILYGGPIKG
jgi:hypothetical protein